MAVKEQLLFLRLLLVVLSFFVSHFWSYVVYALQKAIALGLPLLMFTKFAAGVAGFHVFS